MAFSLRKSSPGGFVGLDIDGDFLAAVEINGNVVMRAVSADLPPGVMVGGEVKDPGALTDHLKSLFKIHGLPKRVRLGVASQQIAVRQIELPVIGDQGERDAAVRFLAGDAIPMPLEDAVLDHQIVGTTTGDDGSTRMQIVVVAARRTMIEEIVEAVRSAGLKPEGIDLDAFALVRTLANGAGPVDDSPARVHCHLGGVTNLAVASGSTCTFTRPLTSEWSTGGDLSAPLADEIRLSIDYYTAQPGARRVSEVVLSGPGARSEELHAGLNNHLGLPVSAARPLGAIDPSPIAEGEDPYRHTIATGLALGATA